jgi:hypothetical protein
MRAGHRNRRFFRGEMILETNFNMLGEVPPESTKPGGSQLGLKSDLGGKPVSPCPFERPCAAAQGHRAG